MEYLSRGGVYTTSVEYLSTGGGGYTTSVEYFFQPPIFPNAPFSTLFFLLGGGVPLCCMDSHSSQLSIFMMVFLWWVAVLGEGECQTFSCPFLTGRKEGRGRVPHFYQTFAEMCSVLCP